MAGITVSLNEGNTGCVFGGSAVIGYSSNIAFNTVIAYNNPDLTDYFITVSRSTIPVVAVVVMVVVFAGSHIPLLLLCPFHYHSSVLGMVDDKSKNLRFASIFGGIIANSSIK